MKLSILSPKGFLNNLWPELYKFGNDIMLNACSADCDFILGMSITQMKNIVEQHFKFPSIPIVNYNWDIYEWHLTNPRPFEFNWTMYKEVLRWGKIWVPSEVTKRRTKELFYQDSEVIKSFVPYFDHETGDKDYVYLPLRKMHDEYGDWGKRACEELGIPYKESDKSKDSAESTAKMSEYQKRLANCSLIISDIKEASTGSLVLLEGLYLGKPLLANNSEYNASKEYVGDFAEYFDGYDGLKSKLKEIWKTRKQKPIEECQKFVRENYNVKVMARKIHENLYNLQRNWS